VQVKRILARLTQRSTSLQSITTMSTPNQILVIEDDPAVARSLQAGLQREGYHVTGNRPARKA